MNIYKEQLKLDIDACYQLLMKNLMKKNKARKNCVLLSILQVVVHYLE